MARPRVIDREAVLSAALRLADRDGLAGVTMAAVARAVQVTPMALYRHVRDKDDLLDGIVERLLIEIADGVSLSDAEDLGDTISRYADAALRTATGHPEAFLLLFSRPAVTNTSVAIRTEIRRLLRDAGIPDELVASLERITTTTILGLAAGHSSHRFTASEPAADLQLAAEFTRKGIESFIR